MSQYDGSIRFDTRIDETGFNTGIKGLVNNLKGAAAKIGLAIGGFTVLRKTIKSALDYIGGDAVYIRTMGKWADATEQFTEDLKAKMGISRSEMRNFMASIYNLAMSMNIPTDKAYGMSKATALLSQDLGSFFNISSSEALGRLQSGLTGSTEALRSLNININEATLQQEALNLGYEGNIRNLSESEKVMLRYNAIMRQTANAHGFLASTIDTPNAQLRILKDSVRTLAQDFGQLFIPILQAVIPVVNAVVKALTRLVGAIASLFGIKIGSSLTKSLISAESSADTFGTSMGIADNNLSNSAKGAKKLRNELSKLSGFDKLNVLPEQPASGGGASVGGGGGGGIGKLPEFDLPEYPDFLKSDKLKQVQANMDKIAESLKQFKPLFLGIAAGFATAFAIDTFTKFLGSIENLRYQWKLFTMAFTSKTPYKNTKLGISMIVGGLVTLYSSIKKLIKGWDTMTAKEKIITGLFAAIGAAAIALGYSIATGLSAATLGIGAIIAAVATAVAVIASLIAKWASEEEAILSVEEAQNRLTDAKERYNEANEEYISAIDQHEEALQRLQEAEAATGLSGEALFNQVEKGTLDYQNMTEAQRTVYKAYMDTSAAEKKLTEATNVLEEAKKAELQAHWDNELALAKQEGNYQKYKESVIDAFKSGELSAEEAQEALSKAMTEMSDNSQKTFMEDIPDDIKGGLDPEKHRTTFQKFKFVFVDGFDKIKEWGSRTWEKLKEDAVWAFNFIKDKFSDTWEGLKRYLRGIIDFITGIFTGDWKKAWGGVKDVFGGIFDSLKGLVKTPINWIIDKLNRFISGLNKIQVPDWVPAVGGKGINIPQIPKLAKGAVIPPRAEFMAILGDQKSGMNIETPEKLLREIMRQELGNRQGQIIIQNTVPVELDGELIAQHTTKHIYNIEELEGYGIA